MCVMLRDCRERLTTDKGVGAPGVLVMSGLISSSIGLNFGAKERMTSPAVRVH